MLCRKVPPHAAVCFNENIPKEATVVFLYLVAMLKQLTMRLAYRWLFQVYSGKICPYFFQLTYWQKSHLINANQNSSNHMPSMSKDVSLESAQEVWRSNQKSKSNFEIRLRELIYHYIKMHIVLYDNRKVKTCPNKKNKRNNYQKTLHGTWSSVHFCQGLGMANESKLDTREGSQIYDTAAAIVILMHA